MDNAFVRQIITVYDLGNKHWSRSKGEKQGLWDSIAKEKTEGASVLRTLLQNVNRPPTQPTVPRLQKLQLTKHKASGIAAERHRLDCHGMF